MILPALITSAGRPDLLQKTVFTLFQNQPFEDIDLAIQEDAIPAKILFNKQGITTNHPIKFVILEGGCLNKNIEYYLNNLSGHKYYLHCEDDWDFNNSYDWITASIEIMEKEPDVCKVLARSTNNHHQLTNHRKIGAVEYADIVPLDLGVMWYGYSNTPGVTRVKAMKECMPFVHLSGAHAEVPIMQKLHELNYKTVHLVNGVASHTGAEHPTWFGEGESIYKK
jgi:hypothetical protein